MNKFDTLIAVIKIIGAVGEISKHVYKFVDISEEQAIGIRNSLNNCSYVSCNMYYDRENRCAIIELFDKEDGVV